MDGNLTANNSGQLPYGLRRELLDAYGQWIAEKMDQGYKGYLLTFMFNDIPGDQQTVTRTRTMKKDIQYFYKNLTTRVVRKSRTAPDHQLPILIASKDRPVPKWTKQNLEDVTINNGRHFHGIMLIPSSARKNWYCQLDLEKIKLYSHIRTIDIRPISSQPSYTTEYALKDIKNDPRAYDDILILPVSKSELLPKEPRERVSKPPHERMHW